jgi:hypothetical protein
VIETVSHEGKVLAYVIRAETDADKTTFLTPDEINLQLGFVVYPRGGTVARHEHLPLKRSIVGTAEVLLVRKGRCLMDLYATDRTLVATVELNEGDLTLTLGGGHGFRMVEDTVLLEIKQGPYAGVQEKERF